MGFLKGDSGKKERRGGKGGREGEKEGRKEGRQRKKGFW